MNPAGEAVETVATVGERGTVTSGLRSGSKSLFSISFYAFGLSGLWIGYGTVLLQYKVTEIAVNAPFGIFGFSLDKTSMAAFISLVGLLVVALVQPSIGALSDRMPGQGSAKRYPFIIVGLFGLAFATLLLGFVQGFIALLMLTILMQVLSNTAQGPANALILDHVDDSERGGASGYLNLMRLAGSGAVAMVVIYMMSFYDADTAPQWMWYSIFVMTGVMLGSTVYSLFALRTTSSGTSTKSQSDAVVDATVADIETIEVDATEDASRMPYYLFLFAMAVALSALTATQTNALFFLQDVIGLENPARGGNFVLIGIVAAAGVVVYPAGRLSDHMGRGALLLISGLLGAGGVASIFFASNLQQLMPGVLAIGVSLGIYLSVGWAVANDLVKGSTAARDLGLTSVAGFVGSLFGRSGGFFIGGLNDRGLDWGIENLGYGLILGMTCAAFLISGVMFWFIVKRDDPHSD